MKWRTGEGEAGGRGGEISRGRWRRERGGTRAEVGEEEGKGRSLAD